MSLPNLPAGDKFRREVRTEWGGLNLNENAGDGELIEAMNMSSREYPLLSTNGMRFRATGNDSHLIAPLRWNGTNVYVKRVAANEYRLMVESDAAVYGSGTLNITDANADAIRYAATRNAIYIFPAKQVYVAGSHTLSDMESSFDSGASTVDFREGTLGGVPAAGNTIYCSGVNWASYFSVGDAVIIAGSGLPENNKTAVIREIDGDKLHFDENCFSTENYWHLYLYEALPAGSYYFYTGSDWYGFTTTGIPADVMLEKQGGNLVYITPPPTPIAVQIALYSGGTPSGTEITLLPPADADHVTISRTVPNMDFVCVNENRVWGCKGDTIYASKLGDPLNWNVYDGLSTDSWTTETGTPGDFTGCCSFQGYPTFFKGNSVFRVLGDEPNNFTLRKFNIYGVDSGSDRSIVEVRGELYYVSPVGIVGWNGGDHPTEISYALGTDSSELVNAIGGTDGVRYLVELTKRPYDITVSETRHLYVYDTRYGTWHEMPYSTSGKSWFLWDGVTFMMFRTRDENGTTKWDSIDLAGPERSLPGLTYPKLEWRVTFADSTRAYKTALTGSESKKGVLRLLIRCRLAKTMKVWISYDGGDFEEAGEFGGEDGMDKSSRVVPLILRRCDYWQLRLTGVGDAVIYSIAVEKYGGEWQQA